MSTYHLAQINIGRLIAPTDDPLVADFMNALDRINALADTAPGFVWRLQSDSGNATDIRPFDDPNLLVNMSVWESLETLKTYTYQSEHVDFFKRRKEWFEPHASSYVLWWIPAGHIPSLVEAKARLETLARLGPTAEAFLFKPSFPPPTDS